MSERDFAMLDETAMTPEMFAQEAKLASLKLRSFPDAEAETRRLARPSLRRKRRKFDLELAETIVQTGEQEVVVSLRRYVQSVRATGFLAGVLLGFLIGAVASFFSILYVAKSADLRIPARTTETAAYYGAGVQTDQTFSGAPSNGETGERQ